MPVNVDVDGRYCFILVVYDRVTTSSDEVVVTLRTNTQPVAQIAVIPNQSVPVGTAVNLDGSSSYDPDGDSILFYNWTLISQPDGSDARLFRSPVEFPMTGFTPQVPGMYVVTLTVSDGHLLSEPKSVTITAMTAQDTAVEALQKLIEILNTLNPGVFVNQNMRNTSVNKINSVLQDIENGQFEEARDKLTHDLLAKYDGCELREIADKNDWVKDCTEQLKIYQ